MQSKLLSFLQSILLCGPAVGTCTTFPTWNHLIVFLKKRKKSVTWPRTGRESVWRSVDREEGTGLAATYGRPEGDSLSLKVTNILNELTSCKGKAAEKAPWSTRLRTPTSPFFSRPKGVVQSISNTMRLLCAREKKLVMSSLPRNLDGQKFVLRNAFAWKLSGRI